MMEHFVGAEEAARELLLSVNNTSWCHHFNSSLLGLLRPHEFQPFLPLGKETREHRHLWCQQSTFRLPTRFPLTPFSGKLLSVTAFFMAKSRFGTLWPSQLRQKHRLWNANEGKMQDGHLFSPTTLHLQESNLRAQEIQLELKWACQPQNERR